MMFRISSHQNISVIIKMKRFSRLRYKLPLYVAIFVILSLILSLFTVIHISDSRQITSNKTRASNLLNHLQGTCDFFFQEHDYERIQKIISTFASEKDLQALIVVEHDGTIIASNSFRDTGLNWKESGHHLNNSIITDVINNNSVSVTIDNNKNILESYSSLCRRDSDNLRKTECGFIYYGINMEYNFSKARQEFLLQNALTAAGMLAGSLFLIFLVDRLVAQRTNDIIKGIRDFTNGNRERKISVKGNDELTDLGKSINSLFADIATGEYIINENVEKLNAVINTILDGIIVINARGKIEGFNPAAENLFGYSASEIMGKNVNLLMPEPYHSKHDGFLNNYITTGEKKIIGIGREVVGLRKNGSEFPLDLAVTEMHLNDEKYFTGIIRDITERKELMRKLESANLELTEANQQLGQAAITDSLTGLYNRRHFDRRLEEELHRCKRSGGELSLLLCDIDFFKLYNDNYGHQMGDDCLKRVSAIITENFRRGGEIAARYGGEEFVIILPGANSENAVRAAETLRKSIFDANILHEKSTVSEYVTMSIGVSSISGNSLDLNNFTSDKLVEMADKMLYRAKELGRNRSILYPG